jgi:cellulose synthase/poly-beta-1,6-N-acetylglucosamine synthase-like glycosyltransferase
MISPISLSAPTRTSSYMADPPMLLATTTGPETFRMYLRQRSQPGE